MVPIVKSKLFLVLLIAGGPGLAAGCGGAGNAMYVPGRDEARSSLEAALTAWRDGKSPEEIAARPKVQVADSVWSGGARLAAFEIGEEEADADGGVKRFPVKLTLQREKGRKGQNVRDVRYAVHGRDPVWVFAEDDYRKMVNMDNGPEPDRPVRGRGPGRGRRGR